MRSARARFAAALTGLVLSLAARAAESPPNGVTPVIPISPAVQARVDAAVAHHAAGRLPQAAREFTWLAQRAVPAAQYNLGVMHLRRELPGASAAEGERWLMLAARAGFVTAMYALGQALESGEIGRRDLVAAHDWFEVAAERGSVEGMVAIGTAFFLGRGRPADATRAAHWYREAAKGGDVGAQYLIASMYESGEGVAQDLRLARHWYREAARRGDEAAPAKLRDIERRLAEIEPAPRGGN